jgi:YD repeat-containing protein
LTSPTNPESGTATCGYDANGNLTSKVDARSITTTIAYDSAGNLLNDGAQAYTTTRKTSPRKSTMYQLMFTTERASVFASYWLRIERQKKLERETAVGVVGSS